MSRTSPAGTDRAKRVRRVVLPVLLAGLLGPVPVRALNYTWNCSNSFWDITTCWSPAGLPNGSDYVYVHTVAGADTTLNIDNVTGSATAYRLELDASSGTNVTLIQSGGGLTEGFGYVGYAGNGTFIQSGGTDYVSYSLFLGYAAGSNGIYSLSSTGSLTALGELIGYGGTGTFTQSGGSNSVSGSFTLGSIGGSNGTYTLTGGTLNVANISSGTGTSSFNLDGGTLNLSGTSIDVDTFAIGNTSGTNGSFTLGSGQNITSGTVLAGMSGTGALTVQNGAVVNSGSVTLGQANGSNGSLTVTGAGSNLTLSGELIAGWYGHGTLTIQNGGVVSSGSGNLGRGTGTGQGFAYVDGAGSTWTNTGILNVGNQDAQGGLSVSNGGAVSSAGGYIGHYFGANGHVTVTGAGSSWQNSSLLYIGYDGAGTTGTLSVTNGALVSNTGAYIGYGGGSTGTATVAGAGSVWTNNGDLGVGKGGTGHLYVQNAGNVSSVSGIIGDGTAGPGNGTATVTGAGSTWTNTAGLTVANLGTGTLTIQAGGAVSNTTGTIASNTGTGTVTVDGVGSTWSNSSVLTVGDVGTGTLNVTNGGSVSNTDGFLGKSDAGSSGTVNIGGADATWTNTGNLYVGGYAYGGAGNGTLTISDGGIVTVGGMLKLWGAGTVNLNGGTLSTATLDPLAGSLNFTAGTLNLTASDLQVDSTGALGDTISLSGLKSLGVSGTTTLSGAGTLTLSGGTFSTGSLVNNGGFAFNSGTFNLTGDNLVVGTSGLFGSRALVDFNQTIHVTHDVLVDAGAQLSVRDGMLSAAQVHNSGTIDMGGSLGVIGGGSLLNAGLLQGTGNVAAVLANLAGGEIGVVPGDTLRFTAAGNTNTGQINNAGGSVRFDSDLTNQGGGLITGHGVFHADAGLANQGTIALSGGPSDLYASIDNQAGASIIVSGNSAATFYGDVIHNGAEFRVSNGSSAVFFGTVSGSGPYTGTGSLYFEGDLTPGNSPGLVSIEGDMSLGLSARTVMEIAGLERGSQYDAFDVGGVLALGGELDVTPYDPGNGLFAPQAGESFDLFQADSITGAFERLVLAAPGAGLAWQLAILPDAIGTTDVLRLSVVSAVPLPPAAWLFGSGLLGLAGVARRRVA